MYLNEEHEYHIMLGLLGVGTEGLNGDNTSTILRGGKKISISKAKLG